MITESEHKEIFSIVKKFGGDDKKELRTRLLSLLNTKETKIKNRILTKIKSL